MQSQLGGADVLVNNAGVMLLAPFSSDQRAEIRQMVEVNLLGAMTATEVFFDQLRAGRGGDLVNISSVAGRTARAGDGAYAATKWGINGWWEPPGEELQPDIRVTLIEPAPSRQTDRPHHPRRGQAGRGQLYRPRAITAEDIAEIIAFAVTRPRRLTINEILVRPTAHPAERPTVEGSPIALPGASSFVLVAAPMGRNQQPRPGI